MKQCSKCKSLTNSFYKEENCWCKQCCQHASRERYWRNRDRYLAQKKEYYQTKQYKKDHVKAARKYQKANPEKVAAHVLLNVAVRKGLIDKPSACSVCNKELKSRLIQGHHHDYTRPLEVMWVCQPCHHLIDSCNSL